MNATKQIPYVTKTALRHCVKTLRQAIEDLPEGRTQEEKALKDANEKLLRQYLNQLSEWTG